MKASFTMKAPMLPLSTFVGRCSRLILSLVLFAGLFLTTSAAASAAAATPPTEAELAGTTAFNITRNDFAVQAAGGSLGNAAGKGMIKAVGNTVSSLASIITGPVLYIIMGLAIMISVFGFVSGKMVMAFSGIGAFVLAAVLKALFSMIFVPAAP